MANIGPCPKCGEMPRIVPVWNGFTTKCQCPEVPSMTTNGTSLPLPPLRFSNGLRVDEYWRIREKQ